MAVRRRTDPDGEQSALSQLRTNDAEQLLFVAHLSVRQKDHLPQMRRRRATFERHFHGGKNFRASIGMKPLDIPDGLAESIRSYGLRLGEQ